MNRIGKLFLIAALLVLPFAMAGCPADEDPGVGSGNPKPSPTSTLGGIIK